MKTLITSEQVAALAFTAGGDGLLDPAAVAESDIAAAEHRYLVPVVGPALYERLLAGEYAELVTDYLAAPLALWTRVLVQPRLEVHTGSCGAVVADPDGAEPVAAEQSQRLLHALRGQARTLMLRASDHLDARAEDYPEYDPKQNILKRCRIHGDFVQIR